MTRICWWLADCLSRMLEPGERDAVWGDVAESGEGSAAAFRDMFGLVLRRQVVFWNDWRPWLTLLGLVGPVGLLLSLSSASLDRTYDLYLWIVRNYKDIDPATLAQLGTPLAPGVARLVWGSLLLALWSWSSGFVLGSLARGTAWINGALFCLVLLYLGMPLRRRYNYDVNGGIFPLAFYSLILPLVLQTILVLLPAIQGMRQGHRRDSSRPVRAILWAAAVITALAVRSWFWWPFPDRWKMQLLSLAVYWPIGYLVVSAVWRRSRTPAASVAAIVTAVVLSAMSAPAGNAQSSAERPEFEVASVKLNTDGAQRVFVGQKSPGTFSADNVSLRALIQEAYTVRAFQIFGGPNWIDSDRFDVTAKPRTQRTEERITRESMERSQAEMDLMLQGLLENRFKLRLHRETRELPVYVLTVARSGPKLHRGDCLVFDPKNPPARSAPGRKPPNICGSSRMGRDGLNRTWDGAGMTMMDLAAWFLPNVTGRAIIDKTGIANKFDVHLEWTPDDAAPEFPGTDTPNDTGKSTSPAGPSIFAAVEEQLGLRLESGKGPVEVLVIESVEKLSAN